MRVPAPLANGIRTDHPVPGLPFVDDSLLNLSDPTSIENIGRGQGEGMWGRTDLYNMIPGAWRAFTTDPTNTDYAWVVIHHPENGTSVLLYSDEDAVKAYSYQDFENKGVVPLIVRAGGYWSDGNTWRRPTALRDPVVTSECIWDEPRDAHFLTAQEALAVTTGTAGERQVRRLADIALGDAFVESYPSWIARSLVLWAQQRPEGALPLEKCVLDIKAPELEPNVLLDNAQAAEMAGVEPSTWRAYTSRGTAPSPQTGFLGKERPRWSLPVTEAWISRRDREEQGRIWLKESDHLTSSIVERIRASVLRLGRRVLKTDGTEAVRGVLQGKIIGLTLNNHIPAVMHAAWMVDEFDPKDERFGLPDQVIDQVISLMWLDPYMAERAIREYVSKGVARGYDRGALEKALTTGQSMPEYLALVKRAVKPHWD